MQTESYLSFWQKVHNSAREKRIPLRVMFELTYRCNFKCRHCYVPDSYKKLKELDTKQVFSVLDQLKDIGTLFLGFTGGEPFMRKDIMDILWYARKCGFEVIIYTNGSFIDVKTAKELAHMAVNKVDITIPGINRDSFEAITQVRGSRDRVFKGIDCLYKEKVALGFKTCLLKENKNEIKEIEDFSHSLGAAHRLDTMLLPRLDGDKKPFEYRARNGISDNIENQCDEEYDAQSKATLRDPEKVSDLFRCGSSKNQAAITPLGELKLCTMIDWPKYKTGGRTGLKNAWKKMKTKVASMDIDENYKCGSCELVAYCKWCPARSWLYNKTFTSCDPESRKFAQRQRIHSIENR